MADRLRFHLDENTDPAIARALRRYGIETSTTQEAGLRTQSDAAQWEFICREGRVMVTHDTDFLRLAGTTTDHPGVVYCQMDRLVGQLVRGLIQFYETRTPAEMRGRVEFL